MGSCTPFKTKFWLKHPSSYLATRFIPGVGPREPTECSLSPAPALLPRGRTGSKRTMAKRESVVGVTEGRSLGVRVDGPLAGGRLPDGEAPRRRGP